MPRAKTSGNEDIQTDRTDTVARPPSNPQGASLMAWATAHIEKLKAGQTVQFRPRGHSMTPKIKSGELCTVEPIADHTTLRPATSSSAR